MLHCFRFCCILTEPEKSGSVASRRKKVRSDTGKEDDAVEQKPLQLNRRDFLKLSGVTAVAAAGLLSGKARPAKAQAQPLVRDLRISRSKEVIGVCPFCSVGCGTVAHVRDGRLLNVEGNVEHPISEGSLCPKGAATFQLAYNEHRALKALYRAPRAKEWQEISLTQALDMIADRIKKTRDQYFIHEEDGVIVNRLDAIAHLGSAVIENEDNYALTKLMRSIGVSYLEHHARI